MHRDELEAHRRLRLKLQQDVEQRVRILAARKADHHAIAVDDHLVVGDRLADLAAQALGELAGFVVVFAGEAGVHCERIGAETGAHCTPRTYGRDGACFPLSRLRERVG